VRLGEDPAATERDRQRRAANTVEAAAEAKGKRLGNYQRIAEAKQRNTAARAEAVRGTIAEPRAPLSARCRRHVEPSRHHDRER
jgi:hypothetical protein